MPYQKQSARNSSVPIYGVIMAGGEGQRLWPMSRKEFPKYCLCIGSAKKSLLEQAYERLKGITTKDKIFVITQKMQVPIVRKQLPDLDPENIIPEPFKRNTAAAIGLAAVIIGNVAPDAVMIVVPADHFIPDKKDFHSLMTAAVETIRCNNSLVTIGIKPTYPATGYGYIKKTSSKIKNAYKVAEFVEKPRLARAKKFVKGGFLWNSGMFVWEITAILQALRDYVPKLCNGLAEIDKYLLKNKPQGTGFETLLSKIYKRLDSVSVDNAVLEKSDNVFVIPSGLKWDDVGSWLSLTRMIKMDKNKNIIDANFKGIGTKDCIIISKDKKHLIATCGLKNVVIVHTPKATLVCSKRDAENLRELVTCISADRKTERFC